MNETHFKTILKSEILDINKDIVIVIHKSDDERFDFLVNLVHNEFLSKYVPSINCPQKNWELNTWNLKSISEISFPALIQHLSNGAIIIKKSEDLIKIQSLISTTLWYTVVLY